MEWLDALRGFTMIMVVANHVAQIGFEEQWKHSSSLQFLLLFRMPLFFFISGFLAYKASQVWDLRNLGSLVLKKMRVQLIPTICFFLLATAILKPSFWPGLEESFHSPTKGGYWFTLVLLYMLLTYYLFSYAESKLPFKSCIPVVLLFIVSLGFFETCYLPRYFSWALGYKGPQNEFLNYTSLVEMMRYFPFFLFGNIVHRYWQQAQRLMDSKWFLPVVTLLAVVCTIEVLKWHTLRLAWASLPHTLAMFLLLSMVFMFFRYYHDFFEQTRFGSVLQFIGRRTLDIYLLHYFFLPKLPMVGEFFKVNRSNFILETTASFSLAFLVIGFCIVTSQLLRVSPFLKKYLFGR